VRYREERSDVHIDSELMVGGGLNSRKPGKPARTENRPGRALSATWSTPATLSQPGEKKSDWSNWRPRYSGIR
jgi:hypothetical protein